MTGIRVELSKEENLLIEGYRVGSKLPNKELAIRDIIIKFLKPQSQSKQNFKKVKLTDLFRDVVENKFISHREIANNIYDICQNKNFHQNQQGLDINKENIYRHVYRIIKDIKDKRKGWWADYFYDIKTDSVRRLK